MRLLIDANILLDVLQDRKPYVNESALIWKLCETGKAEGNVLALSFANLVYVMRRELDPVRIEAVLKNLSLIFSFVDLQQKDLLRAAALHWDDFEDAVQSVTAKRLHADFIITRNTKDYRNSTVKAITPADFLSLIT